MKLLNFLTCFLFSIVLSTAYSQNAPSKKYQPIVLDTLYDHNKWGIKPTDILYEFAAYTVSFDSKDDDNSDGKCDIMGVPEWVAYEIKKETNTDKPKYNRPKWMTDDTLHEQGVAPNDDTYAVSGTRELGEVSTDYRYVRGHMCPKDAADRMGMAAGYNTHTVLNAVPQLQWQNNGIWKSLEKQTMNWADQFSSVWVICGPVFFGKSPAVWLGQNGEVSAAVPDALYKIVIRENINGGIETIAFVIPNILPKSKKDYSEYITSIDRVEKLTGLDFLSNLSKKDQESAESTDGNIENW